MRRHARIAVEITPEGVRALALSRGRRPRVLAWTETEIESRAALPRALAELPARLGVQGPTQLLLWSAGARRLHIPLEADTPRAQSEALTEALAAQLEGRTDTYALAERRREEPGTGRMLVDVLALPREPLETWTGLLAASGLPVAGVTAPTALPLLDTRERDASPGGRLHALVGGRRLSLVLESPSGVLAAREIARAPLNATDPVGAVERRLADFQEIERSLLYFRHHHDRQGVTAVTLTGATELTEPLAEQLGATAEDFELSLRCHDAWQDIRRGELEDPTVAARLAPLALLLMARRPLAVLPRTTQRARRLARRRWLSAAAAAALAVSSLAFASRVMGARGSLRQQRDALVSKATIAQTALEAARERAAEPLPSSALDWSALLADTGRLQGSGVELARIALDCDAERGVLAVSGQTGANMRVVTELHEALATRPFGRGLPRLAAEREDDEDGTRLRFVIESDVRPTPESAP